MKSLDLSQIKSLFENVAAELIREKGFIPEFPEIKPIISSLEKDSDRKDLTDFIGYQ